MKTLLLLVLSGVICNASTISNIAYGDHQRHRLDIHKPDARSDDPRPVVVAIHGGGWSYGDKANANFLQPKTNWLNRMGFIVVSTNYRLSPEVTHPAHIEDICRVIAWVQRNIANHGGDPKAIHLLGHSAGAHLAALAAVDHRRLKQAGADPAAITGVILLDGACYDAPRHMADVRNKKFRLNAFTSDVAIQRDASPALRAAELTTTPPPFLILHVATREDSKEQAHILAKALTAKGGTASVVSIDGKNHTTINQDLGKPGDPTTVEVKAFLQ